MNAGQDREPNLSSLLRAGLQQAVDVFTKSASAGGGGRSDLLPRLQALSPTEFESWIAARLRETGYSILQTGGPGDQGIDILARIGRELVVVQCKQFRTSVVGPSILRELVGSMTNTALIRGIATRGILATTGTLTSAAILYARPHRIEVWDGAYLARRWPQAVPAGPSTFQPTPAVSARNTTNSRPTRRRVRSRLPRPSPWPPEPLI